MIHGDMTSAAKKQRMAELRAEVRAINKREGRDQSTGEIERRGEGMRRGKGQSHQSMVSDTARFFSDEPVLMPRVHRSDGSIMPAVRVRGRVKSGRIPG